MKTKYGWVTINGPRLNHDVIIARDKSVIKRSKKKSKKFKTVYGHTPLSDQELLLPGASRNPEVVYIGTGHTGDLPVTTEAKVILNEYETIIRPTPEILELIEEENRPYVAILHVSC